MVLTNLSLELLAEVLPYGYPGTFCEDSILYFIQFASIGVEAGRDRGISSSKSGDNPAYFSGLSACIIIQ